MTPHKVILIMVTVVAGLLWGCDRETGETVLAEKGISQEQIEMMSLRNKLADTAWTWPEPNWPESKAWFQLKEDGTAITGWHFEPCLWTVTSGSTIRMLITSTSRFLRDVKFNSDLTKGTMRIAVHDLVFADTKEERSVTRIDVSKLNGYFEEREKKMQREIVKKLGSY